jgi:SAM-dependent methyltransferase
VSHQAFGRSLPSARFIRRPKSLAQRAYDFVGAPIRLALLADEATERLGLTSLRAERMAAVLPELRGRVLDVGAGDNLLIRLYQANQAERANGREAMRSVGVDVHDWGGGCTIIETSAQLPFAEREFDTVAFVACLNHIPERQAALSEARRVLRPGGRVVLTMIGPVVGYVGHKLWWYSEDKHREMHADERWGLSSATLHRQLASAGLALREERSFVYGLNHLYVAEREER